jgi:uncharacterized protein (DUF1697 family)
MDRLRSIFEDLGFGRVRTHLQSGNVVFEAPGTGADAISQAVARAILGGCGYEVAVATRTAAAMASVVRANPFLGRRGVDPRFLHATFLIGAGPRATLRGAPLPLAPGEAAAMAGGVVYVYCPLGYGRTRINNAFFERMLSARATTRNWQTVTALEGMAARRPEA